MTELKGCAINPIRWPNTPSIWNPQDFHQVREALLHDEGRWTVSEQIDGSTLSISSQGYMASRNKMLVKDLTYGVDLENCTFQNVSLAQLKDGLNQVRRFRLSILEALPENLGSYLRQVVVFGELIRKSLRFNYESLLEKELGDWLVFGAALVFERATPRCYLDEANFLGAAQISGKIVFMPICDTNMRLFSKNFTEMVPFYPSQMTVSDIFDQTRQDILDRKVEGVVCTKGNMMFKISGLEKGSDPLKVHLARLMSQPSLSDSIKRHINELYEARVGDVTEQDRADRKRRRVQKRRMARFSKNLSRLQIE